MITRIPLDVVVTATGQRTPDVIVAVMISELDALEREAAGMRDEPALGLVTTRELLEEIETRMRVTQNSLKGRDLGVLCAEAVENLAKSVLDYRTVGPWIEQSDITDPVPDVVASGERPNERFSDDHLQARRRLADRRWRLLVCHRA